MKIRPYSEQVSTKRIEDAVYHLYKKAQIIDNSANFPQTPEAIMKELLNLVCKKFNIDCSNEYIEDFINSVMGADLDIDFDKINSDKNNIVDDVFSLYNQIKENKGFKKATSLEVEDFEKAEASLKEIKKESYWQIKNELRKSSKLNKLSMKLPEMPPLPPNPLKDPIATLNFYIKYAKQVVPKIKSTFNYFFKSSSSKARKIFVFTICALVTTGYILSPIEYLPEGFSSILGLILGNIIPIPVIGPMLGAVLGWLAFALDDILIFVYIVDWLAPSLDSNYIPSGVKDEMREYNTKELPQLENNPNLEEGEIYDVESKESTDIKDGYSDIEELEPEVIPNPYKESYYMLKELIKVANSLDLKGYNSLADETDAIIKKLI